MRRLNEDSGKVNTRPRRNPECQITIQMANESPSAKLSGCPNSRKMANMAKAAKMAKVVLEDQWES